MRLIDADILLGYVQKYDRGQLIGKALRAMLEKSPTVDAVPVVRCKDCTHWIKDKSMKNVGRCFGREHQWMMHIDGYCSEAERRTE